MCQLDTHHSVFQCQLEETREGECKENLEGSKKSVVGTFIRCIDPNGGGYSDVGMNASKNRGDDSSVSTNYGLQLLSVFTGNENGGFSAQPDNGTWERPDKGDEFGDQMKFEDGGEDDASC